MARPAVDYERHGRTYAAHRRGDPRIAAAIRAALGDARTVLNVGAGTGSYEPADLAVVAVEPSAVMRAQRPPGAAAVVAGRAEDLPVRSRAVDAAMACLTVHHWDPASRGLAEMRRVATGPVVVFTFELSALPEWQQEYLAEGLAVEAPRFGDLEAIGEALGGRTRVVRLTTPADCTDGFFEAFWCRPEALLDPAVRSAQSMWALLPPGSEARIVERLRADLRSGAWDARFGYLRSQDRFRGSLRLVVAEP
ncbi:class I SAM-dependent methyltransferase [Acidiferrimicrobium sp. IK]|uniref:class I SAM-dependent methyltransferase n=1 Tax=Acidiferrimicrobium sp. IK TaxID=2871700 RepID=UPI0021CB6B10|nr:class I SAM-dependent methyltransferase [Acidiferrimicrobium sp. IK]MCU4183216.1 class I SAM-dependent methyltransferase [Acidiferrimicrobium sp. IK]